MQPLVQVGKNSITPQLINETDRILSEHELIKIKILAPDKIEFTKSAALIAQETGSSLVHSIGRIVILYRPAVESDRNKIKLVE